MDTIKTLLAAGLVFIAGGVLENRLEREKNLRIVRNTALLVKEQKEDYEEKIEKLKESQREERQESFQRGFDAGVETCKDLQETMDKILESVKAPE